MNTQRRIFNLQLLAWLGSLGLGPGVLARSGTDLLLARNAPPGIDPVGYLVSEKLDGVRALWDGNTLRFRSGRTVAAPPWFMAKLPGTPLDGELWLGRGRFDALSAAVRRVQPQDSEWQQLKYMVFELPGDGGTFQQRVEHMHSIAQAAAWPQFKAVEQFQVANQVALQARLKAITTAGGEGLVLHLASAPVITGRSDVLLKLKTLQDAEAVIDGYTAGKGKYAGMIGALDVRTADGQRFKLGTGLSDLQRQNPPAIGSTVTYTYREVTPSGKPRFASFLRIYSDD